MALILGIETSCDETAAAVVRDGRAVVSQVVASQHELHETYGGVVPEIASRAHLERIAPVVERALTLAGCGYGEVDAVAVGNRPGLIGSLLVGVSAAKAVAWATGKPLVGVDHIQAHLHAATLYDAPPARSPVSASAPGSATGISSETAPPPAPEFPALGLVVSGGHTSLYEIESPLLMRLLGKTIDDAVGEAYDKAAVILAAGYPGGPALDKLAQRAEREGFGTATDPLPRSLLGRDSLDFSFSGLKTALLYRVRGVPTGRGGGPAFERSADDLSDDDRLGLAAAFQAAAVDTLLRKLERGLDHMARHGRPPRGLIIGGGVSANSLLRRRALDLGRDRGVPVWLPKMAYCVDNAAMIAGLAWHRLAQQRVDSLDLPAVATVSV